MLSSSPSLAEILFLKSQLKYQRAGEGGEQAPAFEEGPGFESQLCQFWVSYFTALHQGFLIHKNRYNKST